MRRSKPRPKRKPKPRSRLRITVKFWKCTDLGGNQLGIECPGCGGKATVNKTTWINRDRLYTTRGCTYCDWFYAIPVELLPARDLRRQDYE